MYKALKSKNKPVKTIDEKKLCKLISKSYPGVVNLFDDHFQYCNGYMIVRCTYEHYEVIGKLFKVGAIKNFRNWAPAKTLDLSMCINCDSEVEAEKTPYLMETPRNRKTANIFKINGRYFYYDKKLIDIFDRDATFKASSEPESYPLLRVYVEDKLIGIVLGIRTPNDGLTEMISEIVSQRGEKE